MAARILLEPGGTYHIFNHAVGDDDIFREDENYFFFLNKCSLRLTSFADVLAFCLMPNHFHFVLRIKDKGELMSLWNSKVAKLKSHSLRKGLPPLSEIDLLDDIITTQFANLFNSYVQAYNKIFQARFVIEGELPAEEDGNNGSIDKNDLLYSSKSC